jgi:hypothetical protein
MGKKSPPLLVLAGNAGLSHCVEDNAIHLARELRVFTVRRDDLAR